MTPSPKQLFQADKDRFAQLSAVINSDWFKTALCYARAEALSQPGITPDMQRGMLTYEALLLGLCDVEPEPPKSLTPGLRHEFGDLRERVLKTNPDGSTPQGTA